MTKQGLSQLNLEGYDKVETALMRLKEFEPPEGYYLAFSGGKDSVVIYDLAVQAGVAFDAHYSQGGIDPPELVKFIRDHYPDVARERMGTSVWRLIERKGMPSRRSRWCCELIKEHNGGGRYVVTGIRAAESMSRRRRRILEVCTQDKTKIFVNPILDWGDDDVWEYIRRNGLPYCALYDEGWERLGCVLCPMASTEQAKREAIRFPKLANAWKRACYRRWQAHPNKFKTAEDFWQWWMHRRGETVVDEAQCIMFDN